MTIDGETPAALQLRWYLRCLATAAEGETLETEGGHWAVKVGMPPPSSDDEWRERWQHLTATYAPFTVEPISSDAQTRAAVVLRDRKEKRWEVSLDVEPDPPHRITDFRWDRALEPGVTIRLATEADSAALCDLERRSPIVLGDTQVTFDRGDDYFAFARLAGEHYAGIAEVDGVIAAVNNATFRGARVAGRDVLLWVALHTRVLPEHQAKGLWGACGRALRDAPSLPTTHGSIGMYSVDNETIHRGFAHVREHWTVNATRLYMSTKRLAGPPAGRPSTPADAARIVELLNGTHEREELFLPYTEASLSTRLSRAPELYSWERVWLGERAVVGVWPSGEKIRMITESPEGRTVSLRGLVLDYGFAEGADDELESLLRAWCGRLAEHGHDELVLFTSEDSPGYARLVGLSDRAELIHLVTPGCTPPGTVRHGVYVDHIYF